MDTQVFGISTDNLPTLRHWAEEQKLTYPLLSDFMRKVSADYGVLLPALVVLLSLTAASAILLEAGLSFLGLGDPALVSLGSLASNAQRFLRVAWWMVAFPGATIAATAVGFGLLGDALNEALQRRT